MSNFLRYLKWGLYIFLAQLVTTATVTFSLLFSIGNRYTNVELQLIVSIISTLLFLPICYFLTVLAIKEFFIKSNNSNKNLFLNGNMVTFLSQLIRVIIVFLFSGKADFISGWIFVFVGTIAGFVMEKKLATK